MSASSKRSIRHTLQRSSWAGSSSAGETMRAARSAYHCAWRASPSSAAFPSWMCFRTAKTVASSVCAAEPAASSSAARR